MKEGGPWFVLVAGINGAGKSTFAQNHATLRVLLEARGPEIEVINPDLITREILRSEPELPLDKANIRAADECEVRVRDLVKNADRSFVIETVLSTDKYKPIVRAALKRGFQVLFVYVVLGSVEEAIQRVAARVARGGHNVPAAKIKRRWPRSLENLPWFWQRASRALVYFNGSSVPEPVLMAERRGAEVWFALDAPAPWALESLLPRWRPRRRKR
jgi:predicted ABC-type ATPase